MLVDEPQIGIERCAERHESHYRGERSPSEVLRLRSPAPTHHHVVLHQRNLDTGVVRLPPAFKATPVSASAVDGLRRYRCPYVDTHSLSPASCASEARSAMASSAFCAPLLMRPASRLVYRRRP